MQVRHTTCPHDCPSCCALEVDVHDGVRIGTVRGARDQTYTAGVICAKVARYAERVHHPDRVTHPLIRTGAKGEGVFRRATWDEALDLVAARFTESAERHGATSVWPYYYAGTMGLVQRDGINRLRHAMGYSRQHNTICSSITEAGWAAGVGRFGGPDPREMAASDLIVMWGGNPVSTQVNVMTHVTRARKERGALLAVVDPYRTPTAQAADIHIAPRPGTDAALACAMMHVALRDGFADRDYMAQYTDASPALEAHLRDRSPTWAAGITGLPEAEIESFARRYCETERAFIRIGYGFTRSRNGAVAMHAVTCLPSITGKWKHEGAGAFWTNRGNGIYHWDKTLIEGLDCVDPATRKMDMSRIGAALTGDRAELGDGPAVHAMIVQNTNPAVVAPDTGRVRRGLLREDLFVCVHEQFMTETARLADVVLPATMFLEHDDLYSGGGHTFLSVGQKLVEPPGECRSNHEVIQALAARLGAQHAGFGMTAMEMIDVTLRASGWPGVEEVVGRGAAGPWIDATDSFERSHFLEGFGFPGGRFRFSPDWAALGPHSAGMPTLPDQWDTIDQPTAERPFRLITAPARNFLNTTFTETPTSRRREDRPTALLHPDDAARLQVAEGGRLRLGNAQGEIVVHARLADGMQPGTVIVESIWPNEDYPGQLGVNVLTSDAPAAPNGGAVFHDTAVWMYAMAATVAAEPALLVAE
ncbi:MAG: molybdopterin oxidoreductase family protein [Pseudomonadota bacterium]|nr:molybdopterin oxidoreductase family protein [Pseudomonadota bacterium]